MLNLEVKSVDKRFIPTRAHKTDVGYDLHSIENVCIDPGATLVVKTGVSVSMPNCIMATVRGRSGLATKGIFAHVGTIDSGYQGDVSVILFNSKQEPFSIGYGDRIGQLIFSTILTPDFIPVEEFANETDRGTDGFGSTGK